MIDSLQRRSFGIHWRTGLLVAAVLAGAALLGQRPSALWLMLLVGGIGGAALLQSPILGLFALVAAVLIGPLEISTGTEVKLNLASLLIPALAVIWLLDMIRTRRLTAAASRVNLPLSLFLAANLLSLLVGRATWDLSVPVNSNFLLVQLAQWAIFAFSALAFWLTGNQVKDEIWLQRLVEFFVLLGGGLAILRSLPGLDGLAWTISTVSFIRAPFWVLLTALSAGQLLFNRTMTLPWRIFLLAVLGVSLLYAFVAQQEATSNWVGLLAVLGVLTWLRFPRLRWALILALIISIALGVLFPAVYEFAGGDSEWDASGGSRLVLIERVIEVTMRNPITGLGPAAYRPYAGMKPLPYGRAYWLAPQINSHNNYVDLFAHGGILGLALFFWFAWEVVRLGLKLCKRYVVGFSAGYVNGMLAAWFGALVLMAFADWILPFVYNIGFNGFQASVLVWLFMGGLVALERMPNNQKQEAAVWN